MLAPRTPYMNGNRRPKKKRMIENSREPIHDNNISFHISPSPTHTLSLEKLNTSCAISRYNPFLLFFSLSDCCCHYRDLKFVGATRKKKSCTNPRHKTKNRLRKKKKRRMNDPIYHIDVLLCIYIYFGWFWCFCLVCIGFAKQETKYVLVCRSDGRFGNFRIMQILNVNNIAPHCATARMHSCSLHILPFLFSKLHRNVRLTFDGFSLCGFSSIIHRTVIERSAL